MQTIQTATPIEIDTKLAELYGEEQQARALVERINDSFTKADLARYSNEYHYNPYSADDFAEAESKLRAVTEQILPLEAEYEARPWSRYWHVANNNGHIHRNQSCSSCFPDTLYFWRTDLSGLSEQEVVDREAYNACSVCMPIAPAEQRAARESYTKAQREARKAEREAKKDAKLAKQAERAVKFLAKVEKIVADTYGSWDILFRDYSLHGHDGKKSLYASTYDMQATVGDYLYDEMAAHEAQQRGERAPSRHGRDPKEIIAEAQEKGLIEA